MLDVDAALDRLGVTLPASDEDVRRAYLRSVKRHPPERDPDGFRQYPQTAGKNHEKVALRPMRFGGADRFVADLRSDAFLKRPLRDSGDIGNALAAQVSPVPANRNVYPFRQVDKRCSRPAEQVADRHETRVEKRSEERAFGRPGDDGSIEIEDGGATLFRQFGSPRFRHDGMT